MIVTKFSERNIEGNAKLSRKEIKQEFVDNESNDCKKSNTV